MGDGLMTLMGLFYGMAAGPSNAGRREDGKICTAQPGECRHNRKFYTPGMGDAKSWSECCADETCPDHCGYLRTSPRDMGGETGRRARAEDLIRAVTDSGELREE
jgi:hypothetical protein